MQSERATTDFKLFYYLYKVVLKYEYVMSMMTLASRIKLLKF